MSFLSLSLFVLFFNQEIYKDRKKFSRQVFEVASSDLVNMGITVVSYTLKDVRDDMVWFRCILLLVLFALCAVPLYLCLFWNWQPNEPWILTGEDRIKRAEEPWSPRWGCQNCYLSVDGCQVKVHTCAIVSSQSTVAKKGSNSILDSAGGVSVRSSRLRLSYQVDFSYPFVLFMIVSVFGQVKTMANKIQ